MRRLRYLRSHLSRKWHQNRDGLFLPCQSDPAVSWRPSQHCPALPHCRCHQNLKYFHIKLWNISVESEIESWTCDIDPGSAAHGSVVPHLGGCLWSAKQNENLPCLSCNFELLQSGKCHCNNKHPPPPPPPTRQHDSRYKLLLSFMVVLIPSW